MAPTNRRLAARRERTMTDRRKYTKRADKPVVAVRLDLDTEGFTYHKWGETQRCKPGDWLVDNGGDVYSVDADTFGRTYARSGPAGHFVKVTPVWAEVATTSGVVETKEGKTRYEAGDYLVYNEADGGDAYAVTAETFESLYDEVED